MANILLTRNKKKLYPALAAANVMEFSTDKILYKERFEELLEGEAENEFDAWLRDRFYPIVAMMTLSGDSTCNRKLLL